MSDPPPTPSGLHQSQSHPPDPNHPSSSTNAGPSVSHQAAPATVASASHLTAHVLPRRFIGPMSEALVNSAEAEERHRHMRAVRRAAARRVAGVAEAGRRGGRAVGDRRRDLVGRLRGAEGVDEGVFDLDEDEDDGEEGDGGGKGRKHGKKKKKRKDVWVGGSFDIGQEFRTTAELRADDAESEAARDPVREAGEGESIPPASPVDVMRADSAPPALAIEQPARPASSRGTSQDSFVTARTRFSDARSTLDTGSAYELDTHGPSSTHNSPDLVPTSRNSQSSSMHPLITESLPPHSHTQLQARSPDSISARHSPSPKSMRSIPDLRRRLKSAIRPSRAHSNVVDGLPSPAYDDQRKAKTVQFPVDLERGAGAGSGLGDQGHHDHVRRGNKAPADPERVLAREGSDAVGTSAEAAEAAAEDEEDEVGVGQVIMRDRALVRVGYNREDGIMDFDEAAQRRKPCSRMEPMQELIVVWRKGRVEMYEEWKVPLKERMAGHKKLAYVVPLDISRSSLMVFNETDMTIALTTSAGRLSDELDNVLRSDTTRSEALKSRLRQSAQAKWLLSGRRGTHIFIIKFAERTRAMDWYWELWRELDGELPTRLDVAVPTFSTTVRMALPEEDEVGSRATCAAFSPANTVRAARGAVDAAVDLARLVRQRENREEVHLELAWKATDGQLEWVCWPETVRGRRRDWGVLVGLAKAQKEKTPRVLQLRVASHRTKALRLEDGLVLDEPPGVEGYLTRHATGRAKEEVYASTHDGYIFLSTRSHAHPPFDPGDPGATPSDLHPDLHEAFVRSEQRRMARAIEHAAGCVDVRDIDEVRLLEAGKRYKGKNVGSCFEVCIGKGKVNGGDKATKAGAEDEGQWAVFEAQSAEVASEWVDKLRGLIDYWKHRHRVDARLRMDVEKMHAEADPFVGTELGDGSDALLSDLWDWCVLRGCRAVCLSGRLFLRKGKWNKFRQRLIVLTGGCLVAFKIKPGEPLCARKQRYPLYGAYTYSGMMAQDELHDGTHESAFESQARVYQDGLQNTDGIEDRTFCVRLAAKPGWWGKERTFPWDRVGEKGWAPMPLVQKAPFLLVFRARSKLERDRWVWAINAEVERQVRGHVDVADRWREYGSVP